MRIWHPGQDWIFEPGGLGAFDPGINALSILTEILFEPVFVTGAELTFPANRRAPIAAELTLAGLSGLPIHIAFDFRQTGQQTWSIHIETEAGTLQLGSGGGARLKTTSAPPASKVYPSAKSHFGMRSAMRCCR